MSLFPELKRRKVIRVTAAYLAAAWVLVQLAETLLPVYGHSDAAIRFLVAALAVGTVPVIVLAWVYDWTAGRLKKTTAADDDGPAQAEPWKNAVLLVLLVGIAGTAAFMAIRGIYDSAIQDHTIAVLPFQTLGADEADAFTDGIHVGVITRLSGVADLNVISRTSVLNYRASEESLPDIAKALGAAWVLRADVHEVGGDVLVSAQLADALEDRQVWAEEFRRTLTAASVFDIQADISRRIIAALKVQLTPNEERRIDSVPTEVLEAYRLFEQGRVLLDRRTAGSMRQSIGYFERSLEADQNYAPAWIGLADALILLNVYHHDTSAENVARAEAAVTRAFELDDGLAEAYASRSLLHYIQRDGPKAIKDLGRAVLLRPSDAQAYTWRNFFLSMSGEAERARESALRAVNLDPLNAEAFANLSGVSQAVGRLEEALAAAKRVRELAPGWSNGALSEGQALYALGRFDDAIEILQDVSVPWTGAGAETYLALSYVALDQHKDAQTVLARIESSEDAYSAAIVRASLGAVDEAYDALFAVDSWDGWRTLSLQYGFRSVLDPGDDDPRYVKLVRKVRESWDFLPTITLK